MMGLGDVSEKVVPKVILLAKPRHGGTITSRYFVPHKTHAAHAVTGAICLACCCVLEDGVAAPLAELPAGPPLRIRLEHPPGVIELLHDADGGRTEADRGGAEWEMACKCREEQRPQKQK